jgi:hypothetical protein
MQDHAGESMAVCLVEITEFHTLLSYIRNVDNNDITMMMATNIERQIHSNDRFFTIDIKRDQQIKLAKIQEGVFGILYAIDLSENQDEKS